MLIELVTELGKHSCSPETAARGGMLLRWVARRNTPSASSPLAHHSMPGCPPEGPLFASWAPGLVPFSGGNLTLNAHRRVGLPLPSPLSWRPLAHQLGGPGHLSACGTCQLLGRLSGSASWLVLAVLPGRLQQVAADWAGDVLLEPGLDALRVEGVLARELLQHVALLKDSQAHRAAAQGDTGAGKSHQGLLQ